MQQTLALQSSGLHNIDVGCFQINLANHPLAFANLDEAFDPVANAQYAARFLASLHARLGTWEEAVAAYHSTTPALGIPYRQAVFAGWKAPEGWQAALAAAPTVAAARQITGPVTVFSVGGAVVRVWTPSAFGSASPVVAVAGAPASGMPRIIVPGG